MEKQDKLNALPSVCKIETFLASGLIDLDPITLRRWCQSGKYPHGKRHGKYWYIDPRQFMAWFDGQTPARTAAPSRLR